MIQFGKSFAEDMFQDFVEHGTVTLRENDSCGRLARVNLFMCFRWWTKIKEEKKIELGNLAYEAAKARWEELVDSRVKGV
ncbi:MAG: hypothetical protein WC824_14835 [Bacteroidota bacterium]|jgi:hypothetical protein